MRYFLCFYMAMFFGLAACGGSSSTPDGGGDADGGVDPWVPPLVHVDEAYVQEISSRLGQQEDARAIGVDSQGDAWVAFPDGVYLWVQDAWQVQALPVLGEVFDLALDDDDALAVASEAAGIVDGQAVDLPVGAQPRFVGPRMAGGFWFAGESFAGYFHGSYTSIYEDIGQPVRAVIDLPNGDWLAATPAGVVSALQTWTSADGLPSDDVRSLLLADDGTVWAGTPSGLARLEPGAQTWVAFSGEDGLHCGDIRWLGKDTAGALLVACGRGGSLFRADGSRRYYLGRNWLPDDEVRAMALDADGAVWFATAGGVSRVEQRSMTLADRASIYDEIVQARHVRLGYTSTQCPLTAAGDVESAYGIDDDNDGQWTNMYLASQCFRYAVTGDEQARENARVAAAAMMHLEQVTPIDGFFARSTVEPELCPAKQAAGAGEWHLSEDESWCWKGDTSSDEFVGHIFGLSLYHDLVADETEKQAVAATLGRILDYLIDNGYRLLDVDGEVTSHGNFDPEWMENDIGALFGDAGLNSAMLLGGLRAAYHATGEPRFLEHFELLAHEHNYKENVRRIEEINLAWHTNHDSEEMSFLAMYTLVRYEDDPELLALWLEGFEYLWEMQRPERNPEFDFIYAASVRADLYDLAESVETLQKMPLDLVLWGVDSSQRLDLDVNPQLDRHGDLQNRFVLPYDEREVLRWAENPYRLVQPGSGRAESSGIFWLLPYWMARYHGMIR